VEFEFDEDHTSPFQFDGVPGGASRAPEHGEDTESVPLELGMTWDEITTLKDQGAHAPHANRRVARRS
jgi:hypothetical protein